MKLRTIIIAIVAAAVAIPILMMITVAVTRAVGCGVIYCSFDQDGIATIWASVIGLFGGVVALIGAIWIAQRQSEILARQTEIQAKQVEIARRTLDLENVKLRADLYERRVKVYDRVRAFIGFWHMHDRVAGYAKIPGDDVPEPEAIVRRDFIEATNEAQFLFGKSVNSALSELRDLSRQLQRNRRKRQTPIGTDGRDEAFANAEGLDMQMTVLDASLPRIFGVELGVGDFANDESD